jgi:hypothetical protein
LAACETVDDEDVATPGVRCGLLDFVSVAGVGDPLVGAPGVLLAVGGWLASDGGATNAADGGTETAPLGVADSLVTTGADGVADAALFGLCAAVVVTGFSTVVVTGAGSVAEGAATRGAGGAALVAGVFTVVVGAEVVCTVTGGGSGVCVCGGDATLGDATAPTGAFGGAEDDSTVTFGGAAGSGTPAAGGTSAALGSCVAFTCGSGTGTVVVVGATGSVPGLA